MLILLAIGLLTMCFLIGAWIDSVIFKTGFFRRYGLSIALFILFMGSWVGQGISEWKVHEAEQKTHGESGDVGEYLYEFSQSTFENWQSEFLQLFAFVTLSAVLIHKGSGESKDGDEEMNQRLKRIEEKLDSL